MEARPARPFAYLLRAADPAGAASGQLCQPPDLVWSPRSGVHRRVERRLPPVCLGEGPRPDPGQGRLPQPASAARAAGMSRHDVEHGSPGWCAWVWDCLVEALERLALPAAQQVRLTWLGRIPDELALHFHEAWLLVPQLVERGWIGAEPRAALPAVDQLLTAMSDHDTPDRAV